MPISLGSLAAPHMHVHAILPGKGAPAARARHHDGILVCLLRCSIAIIDPGEGARHVLACTDPGRAIPEGSWNDLEKVLGDERLTWHPHRRSAD
jgi:hypothetical protein